MEHGKLVRDRIPEIIRHAGGTPRTRILTGSALRDALDAKLYEEVGELVAATTDAARVDEIADVIEVLRTIAAFNHVAWEHVEELAEAKRARRGGFDAGIWLSYPADGTIGATEPTGNASPNPHP